VKRRNKLSGTSQLAPNLEILKPKNTLKTNSAYPKLLNLEI
jgi:hypothetical protein